MTTTEYLSTDDLYAANESATQIVYADTLPDDDNEMDLHGQLVF